MDSFPRPDPRPRPSLTARLTGLLAVMVFAGGFARGETIHVFLIGGQSNADGRANITGATQPLPTVLANPQNDVPIYWGSSESSPSSGNYPFLFPGELTVLQPGLTMFHPARFGPELSFGRSMADYYGASGGSIALIKYGVGGTNLAVDWKAGGDGTTSGDGGSYLNFQTIVTDGMAALQAANPGATLTISGMIWMQGESDAAAAYNAAYQSNLTSFISDIRLTYGSNLPFMIGQLSNGQTNLNATYRNAIRDAQANVAAADLLSGLVVTDGFGMDGDNLHFNRPGQVSLGNAFASQMQNFVAVPEPSGASLVFLAILVLGGRFLASGRLSSRPREATMSR